ncbi:uncharacterized, partial [Tachysurus ichikawai]
MKEKSHMHGAAESLRRADSTEPVCTTNTSVKSGNQRHLNKEQVNSDTDDDTAETKRTHKV